LREHLRVGLHGLDQNGQLELVENGVFTAALLFAFELLPDDEISEVDEGVLDIVEVVRQLLLLVSSKPLANFLCCIRLAAPLFRLSRRVCVTFVLGLEYLSDFLNKVFPVPDALDHHIVLFFVPKHWRLHMRWNECF